MALSSTGTLFKSITLTLDHFERQVNFNSHILYIHISTHINTQIVTKWPRTTSKLSFSSLSQI